MLEETAFDLGYTAFEATDQVLRMADQSRVNPVGKLSQVPTRIGGVTYLLNFVIIRVQTGRPFPMLLGRPWLYSTRVLVDWGAKEFVIGKPSTRMDIPRIGRNRKTRIQFQVTSWTSLDEGRRRILDFKRQ
jgi:hypothetical protein